MAVTLYHAHPWQVTAEEAIAIQHELAALVQATPLPAPPSTVAGVDMSVRGDRVQAAVVVLALPELTPVDQAIWQGEVQFPYVPGLLSFREAPAVIEALGRLRVWPELILADAQGQAHPRRLGLASHLGVLLETPVVGVAKSLLVGKAAEPEQVKGATAPLLHRGEQVGVALRTRPGVKPVYVSIGHRITLEEAVTWTVRCTTRFRLPEPTRLAHKLSRDSALAP